MGGRIILPATQIDKDRKLLLQQPGRVPNCIFGINRAVRLDFDDQLVEVGTLLDPRGVDDIGHTTNRTERRVDEQLADRAIAFLRNPCRRRLVASSQLDLHRHVQLAFLRQAGDEVVGVDDFDVVVEDDVTCMDGAWSALVQRQHGLLPCMHADIEALEVQQDLGHVLLHAFDGRVLVEHTLDLHFGDRATGHGGKKHAAQRIAQRMAEAPVQGLERDLRRVGPGLANLDDLRLQELGSARLHQVFSVLARYFE